MGSFVQVKAKNAGSVSSDSQAFTSSVTANSTLVAHFRLGGSGLTTSVSDDVNGTWTRIGSNPDGFGDTIEKWWLPKAAAGTTTVSLSISAGGPVTARWSIMEGALGSLGGAIHQQIFHAETGLSFDSGNITTTIPAVWLVAGIETEASISGESTVYTAGSGYTLRGYPTADKQAFEEKDVASTGTYNATATFTTSGSPGGSIWLVAFYAATAGGSTTIFPPFAKSRQVGFIAGVNLSG